MQSVDEINAIVEPETGWQVELATTPGGSDFLRLYRRTGPTWEDRAFITSLPRETGAGIIVAMSCVAKHFYQLAKHECGCSDD